MLRVLFFLRRLPIKLWALSVPEMSPTLLISDSAKRLLKILTPAGSVPINDMLYLMIRFYHHV